MHVNHDLASQFGDYLDENRAALWRSVCEQLPIGSNVSGHVVLHYPFGWFVDIGVGFPALLLITKVAGESPALQADAAREIRLGTTIEAHVDAIAVDRRQIGLSQRHDEDDPGLRPLTEAPPN